MLPNVQSKAFLVQTEINHCQLIQQTENTSFTYKSNKSEKDKKWSKYCDQSNKEVTETSFHWSSTKWYSDDARDTRYNTTKTLQHT